MPLGESNLQPHLWRAVGHCRILLLLIPTHSLPSPHERTPLSLSLPPSLSQPINFVLTVWPYHISVLLSAEYSKPSKTLLMIMQTYSVYWFLRMRVKTFSGKIFFSDMQLLHKSAYLWRKNKQSKQTVFYCLFF